MGNCGSAKLHFVESNKIPGQTHTITAIAEEFGMTAKDVDLMFSAFSQFDPKRLEDIHGKQQAGFVNVVDFFVLNQITNSSFAAHMSETLFFSNKTGHINFEEFLVIVWHLITLREKQLSAFAFTMFDTDDDQVLESDELMEMFKLICGPNDQSFKKLHDAFSSVGLTKLNCTLEQFTTIIESNASLLFPVFEMQLLLRDRTIGSRFLHLQNFKAKKFGFDKKLDAILETFQLKPDCYLHRDDFKKGTGKGKKGKKATEVAKPVQDIQFDKKTKKMHADAHVKGTPKSPSTATKHANGHRRKSTESTEADHQLPSDKNDHHTVGGGWETASKASALTSPPTKHTKDYIAHHRIGNEYHDPTEQSQLIEPSEKHIDKKGDDRSKSNDNQADRKFHSSSHHGEHQGSEGTSAASSPNKSGESGNTNKVAIEEGWHASV